MAFKTTEFDPSASLLASEIAFVQALALAAGYTAGNIALLTNLDGVSDISSQFDGATTTFTVPSYSSITAFLITGWAPNGILRPTVDFTTPTSTSVALVSAQVSAPVAGTTGIIIYRPL